MTTFRILIADDEPLVRESYRKSLNVQNKNKSIEEAALSIFDEPSDLDVLWGTQLEEDLYELTEVSQGELAVKEIEQGLADDNPYSLIFLDMRMPPGIDGMETACRIRKIDPHVEIVIITAYSDYSFKEIIKKVGNPERLLYFQKPFNIDQIKQLTVSLTERWLAEQKQREQNKSSAYQVKPNWDFREKLEKESNHLEKLIEIIKKEDQNWKDRADKVYELKLDLNDPEFHLINQLRKAFRFFIIPALERELKLFPTQKRNYLHFMPLLQSQLNFDEFIEHFFPLAKNEEQEWQILEQDIYEEENFILYDLLKSKLWIDSTKMMIAELEANKADNFSTHFDQQETLNILKNFKDALLISFKQLVKPKYLGSIYENLDISYISNQAVAKRRKEQVQYCNTTLVKREGYLKIFFQILFKNEIKTKIKQKNLTINYDLINYEIIRRDFITGWLDKLGDKKEKKAVYNNIFLSGKKFADWLIENPKNEKELLNQLPLETFNGLAEEVSQQLPEREQLKIPTLSKKEGLFKEINTAFYSFIEGVYNKKNSEFATASILAELSKISDISQTDISFKKGRQTEKAFNHYYQSPFHIKNSFRRTAEELSILFILESSKNNLLYLCLDNALKRLSSLKYQLTSSAEITSEKLARANLILIFDANCPDIISDNLKPEQEVISFDYPVEKYLQNFPFYRESALSKQLQAKINFYIKEKSLNSGYQKLSRLNQLIKSKNKLELKISNLEIKIKELFPILLSLLYWLNIESLLEEGHLDALIKKLIQVHKLLIINNTDTDLKNFFQHTDYLPGNVTVWNKTDLTVKLKKISNSKNYSKEQLMSQPELDNYHLSILLDWEDRNMDEFNLSLRCKRFIPKKEQFLVQIYQLNLYNILSANYQFRERYQKKLGLASTDSGKLNIKGVKFQKLRNEVKKLISLKQELGGLKELESKIIGELTEAKEKELLIEKTADYIYNKIMFFQLSQN